MKKFFHDQHGFALFEVVLLTLITSFAAMIWLNAVPRAKNPQSTLKMTALYVAEEQFAHLESFAAAGTLNAGTYSFQGRDEDLTTENAGAPIKFTVDTQVINAGTNIYRVIVKVGWKFGGKDFEISCERRMRVVPTTQSP
ncbi:MAG: hypothetical protein IJ774_14400 [Selenomonadaceae bacterium]|nr:hypothetical protein [Selenomonadaceae bacterium]